VRIAHFDCFSGISGDMTLGALIGAGVPVDAIRQGLNSLQLQINLEVEEVLRGCFAATYVTIKAPDEQPQRFLKDIQEIIHRAKLSNKARTLALTIFQRIGEAEAVAHGIDIDKVHFHEVGAIDSIADIVGSAIGLDLLGVDEFTSRPVPTGSGSVKAAHGLMPIPTPATAALLKGVPLASSSIKSELTTPTGAAILTTIVSRWLDSPVMKIENIGYGAGTKDFAEQPNVLRLFVGQALLPSPLGGEGPGVRGTTVPRQESPIKPAWQRWNDYGIGCLLEGGAGSKRGEVRQSAQAFQKMLTLGDKDAIAHGHLNLARVLIEEGRLTEAAEQIEKARQADPPAPWWLVAWFSGIVQAETANKPEDLDRAIAYFEQILDLKNQPTNRKFDFTSDYIVIDRLAQTLFRRAQMAEGAGSVGNTLPAPPSEGGDVGAFVRRAIEAYERVLALEPEMLDSHFGLSQCFGMLAGKSLSLTPFGSSTPNEQIDRYTNVLTDAKRPSEERIESARELTAAIYNWHQLPMNLEQPRLPRLQRLSKQLYSLFQQPNPEPLSAALAAALAQVHLQIHALLKPDELARSQAIRIYRSAHPADSAAADPIVIYPTEPAQKNKQQPIGKR
jgi:tetratricopeptide (TPR) repeat protein